MEERWCFMGIEFQLCRMKNSGDWLHSAHFGSTYTKIGDQSHSGMNIRNATEPQSLNGEDGKLYGICILPQLQNKKFFNHLKRWGTF